MMFGGKSMGGGGGGGGGNLLRSVSRVVTRANFAGGSLQEPNISNSSPSSNTNSHSSPPRHVNKAGNSNGGSNNNNNISVLTSSPFASCNVPVSSVYGSATWPHCDELDWVSVDDDHFLSPPVPSEDEVHSAVSALQQVFNSDSYYNLVRDKLGSELDNDEEHQVTSPPDLVHHVSPAGSEIDWIEPSLCTCDSKLLQCGGSERVHDAFRLLRTEPLVQKMVKSLSSDAAVWNAVLNNEVVRELRESFSAVESNGAKSQDESDEDSGEEISIVKLIFDSTRAKIMEVVEKITKLAYDLFRFTEDEKTTATEEAAGLGGTESFKEKLRTSFMLSIMVLLVVVVTRAHKA